MHNDQIARIDSAIPRLRAACDREWNMMSDESAAGRTGSGAWQNAKSNLDGNTQHITWASTYAGTVVRG